jgi:hypothetical protein
VVLLVFDEVVPARSNWLSVRSSDSFLDEGLQELSLSVTSFLLVLPHEAPAPRRTRVSPVFVV